MRKGLPAINFLRKMWYWVTTDSKVHRLDFLVPGASPVTFFDSHRNRLCRMLAHSASQNWSKKRCKVHLCVCMLWHPHLTNHDSIINQLLKPIDLQSLPKHPKWIRRYVLDFSIKGLVGSSFLSVDFKSQHL